MISRQQYGDTLHTAHQPVACTSSRALDHCEVRSEAASAAVQGLLAKDPRRRLTAAEALEHAWFTGHAHNDAATLKHAHTRAAALAAGSPLQARANLRCRDGLRSMPMAHDCR